MKTLLWISLILPLLACSSPEPINYVQEFEFVTSEANALELHLAKGETFQGYFSAWTIPELPPPPESTVLLLEGATQDNVSIQPTFGWHDYEVSEYRLSIATDPKFDNIVYDRPFTEFSPPAAAYLQYNTAYYWRFIVPDVFIATPTDSRYDTLDLRGTFVTQQKPSPPPAPESAELVFYVMNYWQQTILDTGRVHSHTFEIEASESSVYYLVFNAVDALKVSLIYNGQRPLPIRWR